MKPARKLLLTAVMSVFLIVFGSTPDALCDGSGNQNGYTNQHRNGGSIGVPLDGGLLVLLAGAGIAYFVSRKKRKGEE